MDYEMKTINKTLLLSWLTIVGILLISYFVQVLIGERSVGYLAAFALIMVFPWSFVFAIYKTKKDYPNLGYFIVAGYCVMYAFVMHTGSTQMVSVYILPLLSFLILYHRPFLIIVTGLVAVLINIFSLAVEYGQDAISKENSKEIEIRFAAIILCFVGGYICARLYDKVYNERVSKTLESMKAEASNEAKSKFLASMSHEIRTPINAVLGMDTMILRESKEPKIKEYAMDIQNAGRSLLAIINDILDVSKIESGKMEIIEVEYDFASLVHDTVGMISQKAEGKGLKLNVEVDEEIPCTLFGDDVRIRQVLVNLLSNAVKYTEQGEILLSIKGEKEGNTEKLRISVKDTGIGIKDENIPKLFEEFERIEELRNRHIEGTGLGIAITVNLLKLMNSNLEVKSEYGKGSEFSFDIEQGIIDEEKVGDIASRILAMSQNYEYAVSFTAPEAKVLVVDDNQTNLLVFKNLLKETMLNIDVSSSGKEALELVRENKYDIIFLDHMMPDMDGIEVMRRIVSDDSHRNVGSPVIALTANAVAGAKEKYMEYGFTDYLAKPIIPEKLEKLIADYLPKDKMIAGEGKVKTKVSQTDELPKIEGVNWDYAILHLGDWDSVHQTLEVVYNSINIDADEIEGYLKQIDKNNPSEDVINSFRIKIHSIKSTATMLGIIPIAGMAATLEFAARDGMVDKICEMTPYFLNDFRAYKNKLKEIFVSDDENKEEITDKNALIEHIRLLMENMESFDVHGADMALEKIKSYRYNSEIDDLLDKISGAVSNLDTDHVNIWCEELIEEISKL